MQVKLFGSVIFIIVLTATQIFAQSATVKATAAVMEPLSLSGTNSSFEAGVLSGISTSVAKTSTGAAEFNISGEPGKEITADFILPAELRHSGDGAAMPLSFGGSDGGYFLISDNRSTADPFDPESTFTHTLESSGGKLYLWLEGTAKPAIDQKPGLYTAEITLNVAYTGN